jgi:hypothetical protein
MLGVVGERYPKSGALGMGLMGGIGMLSAGLLGGPGIGYKQDRHASNYLQSSAEHRDTYERYKSADRNGFLFFEPVQGLDGAKVATLTDPKGEGATLKADLEKVASQNRTDENLNKLNAWWLTAMPYATEDKGPVQQANLHGGRTALRITALVPTAMAVGYLLLVLYFAARGGYKAVHLDASGREIETSHTPDEREVLETAGPRQG